MKNGLPPHKINNGSLSKMRFIKVGDKWVSKEEEQVGPSREDQIKINDGQQAAPNAGNQFEPEQTEQCTENQTEKVVDLNYEASPMLEL